MPRKRRKPSKRALVVESRTEIADLLLEVGLRVTHKIHPRNATQRLFHDKGFDLVVVNIWAGEEKFDVDSVVRHAVRMTRAIIVCFAPNPEDEFTQLAMYAAGCHYVISKPEELYPIIKKLPAPRPRPSSA